jgi:hypothetical protein
MAPTKTLAALAAALVGTVCTPSSAPAQSFLGDLLAAPFYIASGALATAGSIVNGPWFGYYGYPGYEYPPYGLPAAYGSPAYAYPPNYPPPPPPYRYAPAYYPYGPVTYYFGPTCGYDRWGRWACAVR